MKTALSVIASITTLLLLHVIPLTLRAENADFIHVTGQSAQTGSDTAQTILALEEQMEALQRANNPDRTALWGEDLVCIGNDSAVHDKASLVRAVSAGEAKTESLQVSERKIRVYGDAAIVTAKQEMRASFHGQPPSHVVQRYTRVWTRRGSKWQVVSFQATKVMDASIQTAGFEACSAPDAPVRSGSIEQAILRLEDEHTEASAKGNAREGTGWLGDDYIGINGSGRLFDKPAVLELYKPGSLKYRYNKFGDRRVRVYGDTAILTGTWCLRQLREGQKETTGSMRITRVWAKRDAKWEVVSWQGTPVPAGQNSTMPRTESGGAALGPSADCNAAASNPLVNVALPGHPFSIISTPDGCWLFVSLTSDDPNSNGVAVLRRTAGTISLQHIYPIEARKGRNPLRPGPSGMVMTHDGQLLIAANDDDLIFLDVQAMISGKADAIVGHLNDGAPKRTVTTSKDVTENSAGSIYVNVTKDDAYLFVSDEYASTISVIDLTKARRNSYTSGSILGHIPVGGAPIALTFSPDERWLYTTSEVASPAWNWPVACPQDRANRAAYRKLERPEGAVVVVDVARARTDAANSIMAKVPAGCSTVRLAIVPDGKSIWVSARRSDAAVGFETQKLLNDVQHARLASVSVGTAPVGIAALPDGKHIVVANSNRIAASPNSQETVSVIDIEKVHAGAVAVIGTIPAGAFPREFSLSPDQHALFLGNFLSNTLEVVDLNRLFDILQTSDKPRPTIMPKSNPDLGT